LNMKIRTATVHDIPNIVQQLKQYQLQCPVNSLSMATEVQAQLILRHIIAGSGIALVAERDGECCGVMLAMIDQNIWDPQCLMLKELVYWVDPKHRGTTAGYRLLHKYNLMAAEYHAAGRITLWTISKMTTSPELDYKRFGYTKVEETWTQGA